MSDMFAKTLQAREEANNQKTKTTQIKSEPKAVAVRPANQVSVVEDEEFELNTTTGVRLHTYIRPEFDMMLKEIAFQEYKRTKKKPEVYMLLDEIIKYYYVNAYKNNQEG